MHHRRFRHKNSLLRIIPFILLILGAVVYFGFYLGYFSNISWTFSPVVIIIIIVITLGGVSSRRRRMSQKSSEVSDVRTQTPYRQYEPPAVRREEKDFVPTEKHRYRNSYEKQFCNYCGIKLESEEQSFCVNCGQKTT